MLYVDMEKAYLCFTSSYKFFGTSLEPFKDNKIAIITLLGEKYKAKEWAPKLSEGLIIIDVKDLFR